MFIKDGVCRFPMLITFLFLLWCDVEAINDMQHEVTGYNNVGGLDAALSVYIAVCI